MPYGYCGKLLRVDLSANEFKIEEIPEMIMRKYLGGKGLITYYLLNEVDPKEDPYSDKNKLIFATGVLTGVPVPGFIRFAVGAKAPTTNGYGQAEAGGFWGPELKKAGFDAIILEGKAKSPVYLFIKDGKAEIRDASHLWGKTTEVVQDLIRNEHGDQAIRIAQIGPGGEHLVRYACITNELKHFNGRCGLGAVMGSKNLKAIAVRGTQKLEYFDEDKVKELARWYNEQMKNSPLLYGLQNEGTAIFVNPLNAGGVLPTENFRKGYFEKAENFSGPTINETILKKREGCLGCSVRCKHVVEINREDIKVDPRLGGPEYETLGAFGSLCGIDDLAALAKASELCNKNTLDSISTGVSIAFAMECYEKGLITKEDTGGLDLCFGNTSAMLKTIELIVNREGIGDLLAEGVVRAAEKIGPEASKFAMAIKGQELPIHDPRGKLGVGLGFAISDTGADHMQSMHDGVLDKDNFHFRAMRTLGLTEPISPLDTSEKKVKQFYLLQKAWGSFNSIGACVFTPAPRGFLTFDKLEILFQAATGWDMSLYEMVKVTERAYYMSRLFNLAAGFTAEDDRLPERFHQPMENGALKGSAIDKDAFQNMVRLYYELSGWDRISGYPKKWKAIELNLDETILNHPVYSRYIVQ